MSAAAAADALAARVAWMRDAYESGVTPLGAVPPDCRVDGLVGAALAKLEERRAATRHVYTATPERAWML